MKKKHFTTFPGRASAPPPRDLCQCLRTPMPNNDILPAELTPTPA